MPTLPRIAPSLASPASPSHSHLLSILSSFLGWIYTLAWSASFYPQVIHNQLHRSTIGLSSDFVALNALGHTSYLVYNTLLYFYEPVRHAYRKRHGGDDNVVQFNDWVFSLHATLIALVTLAQYLYFKKQGQALSRPVRLALTVVLTATVFLAGAKWVKVARWIDIVNFSSLVKLGVTLTKYVPQIHLNAKRKSTQGFSIENIILDLTGGVLSLAQLILDAVWIQGGWRGVLGDWGKLGLSLLSIAFDAVLIWQHYAVYGPVQPQQEQSAEGATYGSINSAPPANSHQGDDDAPTEQSRLLR